jgi:hypothetical protein
LLAKYTRGLVEAVKIEEWVDSSFVNDILARSCFGYTRAVCAELRIPIVVAKELDNSRTLAENPYEELTQDHPFLDCTI